MKKQLVPRNLKNRKPDPGEPDADDAPKLTRKGKAPKGKIPPWVKK